MRNNTCFLISAAFAILLLVFAFFDLVNLVDVAMIETGIGISIFNLLVDIVIGFFTIWGLYWAGKEFAEFAIKPKIHILLGKDKDPEFKNDPSNYSIVHTKPLILPGWEKLYLGSGAYTNNPTVRCGVYLENKKSKAGRNIQIVFNISSNPVLDHCSFSYLSGCRPNGSKSNVKGEKIPSNNAFKISVRFTSGTVVYQAPILVGELKLVWNSNIEIGELPEYITMDYDVYTLDGASNGEMKVFLDWEKE